MELGIRQHKTLLVTGTFERYSGATADCAVHTITSHQPSSSYGLRTRSTSKRGFYAFGTLNKTDELRTALHMAPQGIQSSIQDRFSAILRAHERKVVLAGNGLKVDSNQLSIAISDGKSGHLHALQK